MKAKISNVSVTQHGTIEGSARFSLSWQIADGCRFHVHCDRGGFGVQPSIGRSKSHTHGTVYLNAPKAFKRGEPGFFECRYLDANSKRSAAMLNAAIAFADQMDLWAGAERRAAEIEQQRLADAAAEHRAAQINAAGPELLKRLCECLHFIETQEATRGKALNADEWQQAVADFRRGGTATIGIGRSYLDEARVELRACRELIEKLTGLPWQVTARKCCERAKETA